MKNFFATTDLDEFWIQVENEYPELSGKAIDKLLQFATTYLSEAGFSTMALIKTKQRNRLNAQNATVLAISDIQPRIKKLTKSVSKSKHSFK